MIIQCAVWLYARFNLSLRDVEEFMAERDVGVRGVEVSSETIRRWVKRFGPPIARSLRRGRPQVHPQCHLEEIYVAIGGRRTYLWRAIYQNGEVLDISSQPPDIDIVVIKLSRHGAPLPALLPDGLLRCA